MVVDTRRRRRRRQLRRSAPPLDSLRQRRLGLLQRPARSTVSGTSFEAAAIYDNTTRNGIVVGSVTHDTWKTGVYYAARTASSTRMNVFGGATDATWTHDVLPHGKVTRRHDRLAAHVRRLCARLARSDGGVRRRQPRASSRSSPWSGGVPFGWNSWGKLQIAASPTTRRSASPTSSQATCRARASANGGAVYVNLDSYWDNLSDTQLDAFVAHCHANGQKAGIYWAPFVDWGNPRRAGRGHGLHLWRHLAPATAAAARSSSTAPMPIDPDAPGTKARIDYFIDDFKACGFEYVKLDFLTHGALESTSRFDPTVPDRNPSLQPGHAIPRRSHRAARCSSASRSRRSSPTAMRTAAASSCDTFGAAVGLTQHAIRDELGIVRVVDERAPLSVQRSGRDGVRGLLPPTTT